MPLHISPDRKTGKPPKPGVYVVTFKSKPLAEVMSYHDGRYWGHGGTDILQAMQGLKVGEQLPFSRRCWWTPVLGWRAVTVDREAAVDAVIKALGGGTSPA